ncbi:hypothetical protein DERP_008144 [Dermatophagoides pteronyssinus]|uniref:Uncharacterized protein n=1 Tax=Dermatophagoides pteronyssinus TaxID=6956 RepID=A0ABQ8JJV4_DERPT|nr:hypothetical protein DERP_008144 [Dermatophagoides pteronyssinus]
MQLNISHYITTLKNGGKIQERQQEKKFWSIIQLTKTNVLETTKIRYDEIFFYKIMRIFLLPITHGRKDSQENASH